MVWNKDLAQLKKDLKMQEGNSPPPPPAPPAKPAPAVPKTLEEEDALFLAAIGKSIAGKSLNGASKEQGASERGGEFEEAMSQLKGVKPKVSEPHAAPGSPAPKATEFQQPLVRNAVEELAASLESVPPEFFKDEEGAGAKKGGPEIIQLAAGMTIEVDGQLDLRNHNDDDAAERLKEKVLDGLCLGWRSLHVILGNPGPLHQVFAQYIKSTHSCPLVKHAQAPVPMGGDKAWILYYEAQTK
jgi:hypothetical protein